jgi:DnaD/phage-associated family protein
MPDGQLPNSRSETSPVFLSDAFFTDVMPKIQNLAELKLVLYATHIVLREQESGAAPSERSVTYNELKGEIRQMWPELTETAFRQALDSAVKHGALSRSASKTGGMLEDVYSVTSPVRLGRQPAAINIFGLYEQNVGIITPMIAEELKEAERLYPAQWIADAFKEAVTLNKRSWKYIARILERWAIEGKDSGEYKRDTKKDDPDKYVKGKYGHLVQR